MTFDFKLSYLPSPSLKASMLEEPIKKLQEISNSNSIPAESQHFKNLKEELVKQLQRRSETGESFENATNIIGRDRILLSIYMEYLGQSDSSKWLPEFDGYILQSILGNPGQRWHIGRRRQVALLFFTHFDRIAAVKYLSERLVEAYADTDHYASETDQVWHKCRRIIFSPNGPINIADEHAENIGIQELIECYAIPHQGRFADILRCSILIEGIKSVAYGHIGEVFKEIEMFKEEWVSSQLRLGSAALKVMLERVENEGNGKWPDDWRKWIIPFACDPRLGNASPNFQKWWGWASSAQIRLAKKGIIGKTLDFFISFLKDSLEGTAKEDQFNLRSQFLLAIFNAGKIEDARMVLNNTYYHQLDHNYHDDKWNIARLVGTTDLTSIICLKCKDSIHIIEGTHSFALRVFRHDFPVFDFWNNPKEEYQDQNLRIPFKSCPVYQFHIGNWVQKLFKKLRNEYHDVEWNDVEI